MSNLIDIDLQVDEPEEPEPMRPEVRSADRAGSRTGSALNLPHPPGPIGLNIPRPRLWIPRPAGPAGL